MLKDITHHQHLSFLSLHLSRRLLYVLSLTLRGFNISVRTLCMSFVHLGSEGPRCVRRALGNGAMAAIKDFLLFQIGREDRNGENLYCRSATSMKALTMVDAYQGHKFSTTLDEIGLQEERGQESILLVPRNFRTASSIGVSPNALPSKLAQWYSR